MTNGRRYRWVTLAGLLVTVPFAIWSTLLALYGIYAVTTLGPLKSGEVRFAVALVFVAAIAIWASVLLLQIRGAREQMRRVQQRRAVYMLCVTTLALLIGSAMVASTDVTLFRFQSAISIYFGAVWLFCVTVLGVCLALTRMVSPIGREESVADRF